jgi:acyl carrier protein
MQESEIYARLSKIFLNIFDEEISLSPDTTAQDVDGWDSFTHINLILAIESAFGVKFKSSDLDQMHSVGDIVDFIQQTSK